MRGKFGKINGGQSQSFWKQNFFLHPSLFSVDANYNYNTFSIGVTLLALAVTFWKALMEPRRNGYIFFCVKRSNYLNSRLEKIKLSKVATSLCLSETNENFINITRSKKMLKNTKKQLFPWFSTLESWNGGLESLCDNKWALWEIQIFPKIPARGGRISLRMI